MALIDELVKQVNDRALRDALTKEIEVLRDRIDFGLVFDRHIPETTTVGNTPIRVGIAVLRRDQPAGEEYVVESVRGRTASIRSKLDSHAREEKVALRLLTPIKPFGEPIFPGLRSLGQVARNAERPYHTVIKAENFHALQLLSIFGEGSVDCIYLDPPFNTGARDWKYNNRYVDSNDRYSHSKWLSFMEKRLRLARRLLKPDGVLIVAIDEHELHHLGMLLEDVFAGYLRYMVSIVINSRGSTGTRNFGLVAEQNLFVVPDLGYDLISPRESIIPEIRPAAARTEAEMLLAKIGLAFPDLADRILALGDQLTEDEIGLIDEVASDVADEEIETDDEKEDDASSQVVAGGSPSAVYWRGAVRTGQATSFRTQRPRQFYALFIDPKTKEIRHVGEPLLDRGENGELATPSWDPVDGLLPIWPVDEDGRERVWCYQAPRMRREIVAGNLKVGKFNPRRRTYAVNVKRIRRTERRFREITVWWEKSYDSGSNGTNVLKTLLGQSGMFNFPKSVYEVRDVLATVVGQRPEALIVDFFAGSGTTLHATCLLNAIDGGSRRCILITNNEVDGATADRLHAQGLFPGDAEYEREGVFEHVTVPRVKAVITGRRPDGAPIPGRHKWAGNRPYSEGFDENAEFFELVYLDRDDVELGRRFDAIGPLLWLTAGACSSRTKRRKADAFIVDEKNGYAVLFDDAKIHRFAESLLEKPTIPHVFHVTDAPEAFNELVALLGPDRVARMLSRDYVTACLSNAWVER
jgi:adenine-specific DNA-methyltransferase